MTITNATRMRKMRVFAHAKDRSDLINFYARSKEARTAYSQSLQQRVRQSDRTVLSCRCHGQSQWRDFAELEGPVIALAGSNQLQCLACWLCGYGYISPLRIEKIVLLYAREPSNKFIAIADGDFNVPTF